MARCTNCQAENPAGARFCSNCGAKLSAACPNCGAELSPGAKFCSNCGHKVSETPARTPPESSPAATNLDRFIPPELLRKLDKARESREMVGERRIVTMLFCDVKGSTAAAAQLDPEDWAEIINGAFKHMIGPIYRYEGTVARLMGDGLLAFFGAPIAHEDDPQRAILAGLEIVGDLQPYRREIQQQWGIDLNVRIGVNTGLVVVGAVGSDLRMEYSALGDAINMAARMEQTAAPGTVQISAETYKLIAPLFEVERIENIEIKGKTEPVTAYRIVGRKAEPGSLRGIAGLSAPLIGRAREYEQLIQALVDLRRGNGRIVTVMGEAGLGKSRLIDEARRATQDGDEPLHWVIGRSMSYQTAMPYAPFIGVLTTLLGLEQVADGPDQYTALKERVEMLFPGRGEEKAPFLAQPLGVAVPPGDDERVKYLEPPMLRGMTFAAIAELLAATASNRPTVLVLDDLHWIDPTSLELLFSLMPLTEQVPLLLLPAHRPRREDPSWQAHETAARDFANRYVNIRLQPLTDQESGELVRSLLTIDRLPDSVRQLILDKSEGNPFFLEEVIRSLLDAGLVVRDNGHWQATQEVASLQVPDTLVGVITARLDRLDDASKTTAQAAAVLGREFSADILSDILGRPAGLDDCLDVLLRRELILKPETADGRRFIFKHALTQDAAYESLLLSRRRQLHQLAAESISRREPDRVADIARHYLEARQPAVALPFLVRAGEIAGRAFATPEAIGYFSEAVAHEELGDTPVIRRAYEGLGAAQGMGDPVQALVTYEKMLTAARNRTDWAMEVSALNKLASVMALSLGQFQEAEQYLARAETLSKEHDIFDGFTENSIIRCRMCTARADFSQVVEYMDQVVALSDVTGNAYFKALGLEHTASSLMFLTRFDEAFVKAQETITEARAINDREHEAWSLATTLAVCYARMGDLDAALATADEGLRIGKRIGLLSALIYGGWLKAEIHRWRGEYEAALEEGERALQAALPLEGFADFMVVQPLGTLGTTLLEINDHVTDRVAELHTHALRLLESPAGAAGGGTAWADLGWCALTAGDLGTAEEVFNKGLNYPTMFMLLEKPRHLAGMATLLLARGEVTEARRLADEASAYVEERRMEYLYPLIRLTNGRVRAAAGDHSGALAEFARAEDVSQRLGMRPLLWQSRAAAARSLRALGEMSAAAEKAAGAQATVAEIADGFQDEEMRAAYRQQAQRRLQDLIAESATSLN